MAFTTVNIVWLHNFKSKPTPEYFQFPSREDEGDLVPWIFEAAFGLLLINTLWYIIIYNMDTVIYIFKFLLDSKYKNFLNKILV